MTMNSSSAVLWRISRIGSLFVALFCLGIFGAFGQEDTHKDEEKDDRAGHEHKEEPAKKAAPKDEHKHEDEDHDEADHDEKEHAGEEHADEVMLTAEAIALYGVSVDSVRKQALQSFFQVTGRISFDLESMAHVGSSVEGRVSDVKVRLGDTVKKGDTLLIIDSPALGEAQSELLQKRTEVEVARTSMEVARTSYERARKLVEGKGLSEAEMLKREGEFKAANGALLGAQAAASAARSKLQLYGMAAERIDRLTKSSELDPKYFILAPIDGEVVQREATMGEVVHPGSEPLLILANRSVMWILADVPESKLHGVRKGSAARFKVAGLENLWLPGSVAHVAPSVDSTSQTGKVRIEVSSVPESIKPGMFAQIELSTSTETATKLPEVLSIPDSALQTVEGGPAVFVPVDGEKNTFQKRAVKVGPPVGSWVPVLSGLKEGDQIVVNGSFILKAQMGKAGAAHEH